jgi:hypothetical protein
MLLKIFHVSCEESSHFVHGFQGVVHFQTREREREREKPRDQLKERSFLGEKKLDEGVVLHSWSPKNISGPRKKKKTGLENKETTREALHAMSFLLSRILFRRKEQEESDFGEKFNPRLTLLVLLLFFFFTPENHHHQKRIRLSKGFT